MLRFESPKRVAGKKPTFVEAPKSQWLVSAAGRGKETAIISSGKWLFIGTHFEVVSNKAAHAAGKIFEAFLPKNK